MMLTAKRHKGTQGNKRLLPTRRVPRWQAWCVLAAGFGCLQCESTGENAVSRRLIRAVSVEVSGTALDSDTRQPLAGLSVGVERSELNEGDFETLTGADAVTDESGNFTLSVELDIERYAYLLTLSDPDGLYATDRSFDVYAARDSRLDAGEIFMLPTSAEVRGAVAGEVYAAVGGELGIPALPDARVRLVEESGEPLTQWTATDSDGAFVLSDVPFRKLVLEVERPPVDSEEQRYRLLEKVTRTLYLGERLATASDAGAQTIDVEKVLLPAGERQMQDGSLSDNFMTILLRWRSGARAGCDGKAAEGVRDLGATLFLPGADCDINHLGSNDVLLESGAALDPSGLGRGTCFWPPSLGGADVPTVGQNLPGGTGLEQRVRVAAGRPFQFLSGDPRFAQMAGSAPGASASDQRACPRAETLSAQRCGEPIAPAPSSEVCTVAALTHVSDDGTEPEVLTLFRNRFTREWPAALSYYYELEVTDDGEQARRYPMAIAAFQVEDHSSSLNRAAPIVEVYDRGKFIARHEFNPLESGTESSSWTPFVIEIGSRRPAATQAEDIYFRVVSYDQVSVAPASKPFFYQDIAINRSAFVGGSGQGSLASGLALEVDEAGQLLVLGQARLTTSSTPALFRSTRDSGWKARPLSGAPGSGVLAKKNERILAGLGVALFSNDEPVAGESSLPLCGGRILDIAANPDDPSPSFLVSTEQGLRLFTAPTVGFDGEQPAQCAALSAGTDEGVPPERAVERLVWLPQARLFYGAVGNQLYPLRLSPGKTPSISWPNADAITELPAGALIRSMLVLTTESGEDLFVGTSRGLYAFRGGPGRSEAYHVPTCELAALTLDSRPAPSDANIVTLASHGSRLLLGTEHGVAVSSTTQEEHTPCLMWLPTKDTGPLGPGDSSWPVLPAGVDVSDIATSAGRVYVLTRDQGLFYADGIQP